MNKFVLSAAALLLLGQILMAADAEAAPKPVVQPDKPPVQAQFGTGVRVDEVLANSAAATAGIRQGDVILAIDGKPINSQLDINPLVAASGPRGLAVDIDRAGTRMRLKVMPRVAIEGTVQRKVLGITHTELVTGAPDTVGTAPPPPSAPEAPLNGLIGRPN